MKLQSAYQVTVIYNPSDFTNDPNIVKVDDGIQITATDVAESLRQHGYQTDTYAVSPKNLYYLKDKKTDAFFNLCDGFGMYMRVVKQLEKHGKIFTGPGPDAMALTIDKIATKKVFERIGVPTPKWQFVKNARKKFSTQLKLPLIVKPPLEDCSIGISQHSIAEDKRALVNIVKEVCTTYKQGALIEEFIPGKEIHCTVVGNGEDAQVLSLAELRMENSVTEDTFVYDFEAKWVETSPRWQHTFVSPAPTLDKGIAEKIQADAKRAFLALGMKDYARFDIRYNTKTKKYYFLEVNANPSIYNSLDEATTRSAHASGLPYHQFIHNIFEACKMRYSELVMT